MKLRTSLLCLLLFVFAMASFSACAPLAAGPAGDDEDAPVVKKVAKAKVQEVKEEAPAPAPEATAEPAAATASPSAPGEKPSRTKKVSAYPFYVYKDGADKANHFYPSGWMGDYGDIRINVKETTNPHSGTSCIKVQYSAKGKQGAGWGGVYWQQPANNWGTANAGFDMTGAKKLTFWARGEKGNEVINEFKIGGIQGEFADTDVAGIGPVKLTTEWKQYTIDLTGKDLSRIAGGFAWATSGDENPDGLTMYFDDIVYE